MWRCFGTATLSLLPKILACAENSAENDSESRLKNAQIPKVSFDTLESPR